MSACQTMFTHDGLLFSHNISLPETLSHTILRPWWNHIDTFCPKLCCFPHPFSLLLHWPSSTISVCNAFTSMLAESIQEHLVQRSEIARLGLLDPWYLCPVLCWIHRLPPSYLRFQLNSPSHNSRYATLQYLKCFQVSKPDHLWQNDSRLLLFARHLFLEFVHQGYYLETKLMAKMIVLTISMQPHHNVEGLTSLLWQSLYLKCIL